MAGGWQNPEWRGFQGTDAVTSKRTFQSLTDFVGDGSLLNHPLTVADGGLPKTRFGSVFGLNNGEPGTNFLGETSVDGGGV